MFNLFWNIKVKQTLKPDGSITMKPENDEVLRLKLEHKISTIEIRKIIKESSKILNHLKTGNET